MLVVVLHGCVEVLRNRTSVVAFWLIRYPEENKELFPATDYH